MYNLMVGIDVSKELFSAAGIDSKGKGFFSNSHAMDSGGFEEFLKTIPSHCEDLSKVIIAMESTGCYQINLYSFLTSQGIRTMVVNPLLIANYTKLSLRKTKTDKKDASTIAKFLLDHQEEISQLSVSQDLQDLRDLARERIALSSDGSHQGGDQESVADDLSRARVHRGSLYACHASFSPRVSVGSSRESGEVESHRKSSEAALCGGQTFLFGGGYPSGSPKLCCHGKSGKRNHSSRKDRHPSAPTGKA